MHECKTRPRFPAEIPGFRDWPRILRALGLVDRWLRDPANEQLDDYLRASEARRLVEQIDNSVTQAGLRVTRGGQAEEYWPSFVEAVDTLSRALAP